MPIEGGTQCRPVFSRNIVLIEGGMCVGNFSKKGCLEKVVRAGKLLYYKVVQFSTCSDPGRFVTFIRMGVLISPRGREILLKLIDLRGRLLGTLE